MVQRGWLCMVPFRYEIWFSSSYETERESLRAVTPSGGQRVILAPSCPRGVICAECREWTSTGREAGGVDLLATEGLSGTDAAIRVPCVGRDQISSTPPTIRNRSCILRIPRPTVAEVVAKLNPEPLSERDRRIASASAASRTSAPEAPLCFFTLRRPS